MATRILIGHENGDSREQAVLFDSVTGWAFGPLFSEGENGASAEDRAEHFLTWLNERDTEDPRRLEPSELEKLYGVWLAEAQEAA